MTSEQPVSETTKVGAEIERKFLLRDAAAGPAITAGLAGTALVQGYFNRIDGWSVRLRVTTEGDCAARAWLTLKTSRQGSVRQEIERAVEPDFAMRLLGPEHAGKLVSKIRYRLAQGDLTWEIDRFLGRHDGLWLAEIELPHPDHVFERPDWLGTDVTDDPAYRNEALAAAGGQSGRIAAPAELVAAVRLLLQQTGQTSVPAPPRPRDARLAAKLRSNLLRRKQQARGREQGDSQLPPDGAADDEGAALDREDGSA